MGNMASLAGGRTEGRHDLRSRRRNAGFRQIWDVFAYVYEKAPEAAREDATFLAWFRVGYSRSQGMAVRRMVDRRPDVVSLTRLIDRVWRYPTVLSRERYLTLQGDDDLASANRSFDALAGGARFIDPRIPAKDFEDLEAKTESVRTWVNKSVAHLTAKGKPRESPPLQAVHDGVDAVADLFVKYMSWIRGVHIYTGVIMQPWPSVFRVPWIPDDSHFRLVMDKLTESERRRRERRRPPSEDGLPDVSV
jgi:hypothetical protein